MQTLSWGGPTPSALSDINCFMVAVGGPQADLANKSCTKTDSSKVFFGPLRGLAKPQDILELDIPPGPDRVLYVFGFKATSINQYCLPFSSGGIDKGGLSKPYLLGQQGLGFLHPNSVKTVDISLSFNANNAIDDCQLGVGGPGVNADVVLGQANGGEVRNYIKGLNGPTSVYTDGTKIYLSDSANHRILIWNSANLTGEGANLVLGQTSLSAGATNLGGSGTVRGGFNRPRAVVKFGSKLLVADRQNNRVLVWNSEPVNSGQEPDVVIGQVDFTGNAAGCSSSSLNLPEGLGASATQLFIADSANNRILVYNGVPATNGAAADFVIGQANFASCGAAVTQTQLSAPMGMTVTGASLLVADRNNHRVIKYSLPVSANGPGANCRLGQTTYTANASGTTSLKFTSPQDLYTNGTMLYVSDQGNNRVSRFDMSSPACNGTDAADLVIGQPNFATTSSGVTSQKMDSPSGLAYHSGSGKFLIVDQNNNRVLAFGAVPTSDGPAADELYGQPVFGTTLASSAGVSNQSLNQPAAVVRHSGTGRVAVADQKTNRVLIWNSLSGIHQQAADIVLGQLTMVGASPGTPSSISLTEPSAVAFASDGRLMVADSGSERVLIWNNPSANGAPADVVAGKPNFVTTTGSASQSVFGSPPSIFSSGSNLVVTDQVNNRVLIYNSIPTTNGANADTVVGQSTFSGVSPGSGQNGFTNPGDAKIFDGKFFVVEPGRNRILIWNSIPSGIVNADVVLGQPDFTTYTANTGGLGSGGLFKPTSVWVHAGKLFAMDSGNHRIVFWNSIPASHHAIPNGYLGQPSGSGAQLNGIGLNLHSLAFPKHISIDGIFLYIADQLNHRVLRIKHGI